MAQALQQPTITVTFLTGEEYGQSKYFTSSFRIGRDPGSDVVVASPVVSRNHAEVVLLAGSWWLLDAHSANGVFINNQVIERAPLEGETLVELGEGGPRLVFKVQLPKEEEKEQEGLDHYSKHYFSEDDGQEAGERTMMVRRAFANIQKKQKRRYRGLIALVTCLFLAAGGFGLYKHNQVQKQKALAAEIFYAIKNLELEFADLLKAARERKEPQMVRQVESYRQQRAKLEKNYSKFIEILGTYDKKMSVEDRLILKVARQFGECEILIPDGFRKEVLRYIKKWKATRRYSTAIKRAVEKGYTRPIAKVMQLYDLPPQFFYLAMQESNFDVNACGPPTKWGIAKGMWQFIPATAKDFGLKTGPLAHTKKPDPRDERHSFTKSTMAAAKYLRSIYDTDAQASGLLVMASYNWGHNRVNRMIQEMPENPQERNFWKFFEKYRGKIPKETYDYVFYIFSAAVIGEDPKFFGFEFDNPLEFSKPRGG